MATVSFNGQQLQRELDLVTQVQLPFLAAVTVNRLASVVRKALQHEMTDSFNRVSPFTLKSVLYRHLATKAAPYTEIYLRDEATKGQPPSSYLLPQIKGGMVYQTRFQVRLGSQLEGYNGRYMLPIENSAGTKRNAQGRMRASQYVEALYGIKAFEDIRASVRPGKYRTEGSYAYVPYVGSRDALAKQMRALGKGKIPAPGIYRIMRQTPVQVFKQLERVPTVAKRYDFMFTAEDAINKNVLPIFNQAVLQFVKKI